MAAVSALFVISAPWAALAAASEPKGFTAGLSTRHFNIHCIPSGKAAAGELARFLEEHFDKAASDLGVSNVPIIEVWVYPGMDAYRAAVKQLGLKPEDLACSGDYQIHMVSPASSGQDRRSIEQAAAHELAHCLVFHLVRGKPVPRWLGESVARYESRQWVDPRYLDYLVAGNFPAFSDLDDSGSNKVYQVGYILADFVVERWGVQGLRNLLLSQGDVQGSLGVTADQFSQAWKDFVFGKYFTLCTCD